jgi:hypothetical protein
MSCKNIFKNFITTLSNKRGGEPFLPMMSLKVIPPFVTGLEPFFITPLSWKYLVQKQFSKLNFIL